ncbi:MAG: TerC family protein [Deltaproteobacteria bacterium]|nr:TerC family protein [Deltaproteobacteria bacterium]
MFDRAHIWLWTAFWVIVIVLLAVDLLLFDRKAHRVSIREAGIWTLVWVGLAMLFGSGIGLVLGMDQALDYLTGYVIEKSLSVDNLFIFLLIFNYFGVGAQYQHRVLFWGVFGAIVLRTIMIAAGAALVSSFHWILYLFGGFLVYTGIKLAVGKDEKVDPSRNPAVRLARRVFPISADFHGQRFFVRIDGRRLATPMLLVLVTVEFSDVVFAVDSIPAVFGITTDVFIVLTSNLFAILGLRALFFLLAGIMDRFQYLQYGLALVLTFIGVKMLIEHWLRIPTVVSLAVVGGLLAGSVLISLWKRRLT